MNTHTDGLYGNTCKRYEFDDIGVSYTTCGPTSKMGEWKRSGQRCCCPQWLSPQLHGCYLLFNQATNIALQEMRTLHNDLQYIQ
jgi:hypothetical protein